MSKNRSFTSSPLMEKSLDFLVNHLDVKNKNRLLEPLVRTQINILMNLKLHSEDGAYLEGQELTEAWAKLDEARETLKGDS